MIVNHDFAHDHERLAANIFARHIANSAQNNEGFSEDEAKKAADWSIKQAEIFFLTLALQRNKPLPGTVGASSGSPPKEDRALG